MLKKGSFISNRYEITDKVGSGGMSDVYKAKDHKLNRYVAIKVLKEEFSTDKNFVSKFRVEAQSAAGLSHPNIVNVYDVGEEDNVYYIVMELIEGITLKKYIERKGQLPVREAVSILVQVAQGIEAAHNNHVIHRDIKPQNIIISREGKVKVTDFGIARAVSANTVSSNAMGSVHYISPEQAKGSFIDEKSDVYSLGITLYEMITGRVPFDGDSTVSIALQHVQNEMPSPRIYAPDIPISVERIIQKCTMKKPARRYLKVSSLIADLKKSLVTPDVDFVQIVDLEDNSSTKMISDEEVSIIRRESGFEVQDDNASKGKDTEAYLEDDDYYDDDDDYVDDDMEEELEDVDNPKLDKAIIIGGIVMGVVIIAIVAFICVKYLGNGCSGSGSKSEQETTLDADHVKVPDVTGMTIAEATKKLNESSLGVDPTIKYQTDNKVEAGKVISTSPDVGEVVKKNISITLVVSSGSKPVNVPTGIVGKTRDEAKKTLEDQGFTVKVEYEASEDVEAEIVISIDPAEGSSSTFGATITLHVSSGSDTTQVEVPTLTGLSLDAAKASLESKNLNLGTTTEEYSDTVAAGKVISQSESAKSKVASGTAVNLVISKGPEEKKEVPNLLGLTEAEARTALSELGLNLALGEAQYSSMTSGTVINQDVAYGTKVSSGTTVTVVLSKGPEPTTAAPTTPAETKPAETKPPETTPPETTPPPETTAEEETPTTTE